MYNKFHPNYYIYIGGHNRAGIYSITANLNGLSIFNSILTAHASAPLHVAKAITSSLDLKFMYVHAGASSV